MTFILASAQRGMASLLTVSVLHILVQIDTDLILVRQGSIRIQETRSHTENKDGIQLK